MSRALLLVPSACFTLIYSAACIGGACSSPLCRGSQVVMLQVESLTGCEGALQEVVAQPRAEAQQGVAQGGLARQRQQRRHHRRGPALPGAGGPPARRPCWPLRDGRGR